MFISNESRYSIYNFRFPFTKYCSNMVSLQHGGKLAAMITCCGKNIVVSILVSDISLLFSHLTHNVTVDQGFHKLLYNAFFEGTKIPMALNTYKTFLISL